LEREAVRKRGYVGLLQKRASARRPPTSKNTIPRRRGGDQRPARPVSPWGGGEKGWMCLDHLDHGRKEKKVNQFKSD